MTVPSLKEIARSPTGSLAAGLAISLLLASLASAGLNTLWVARLLLLVSFAVIAAYVWFSDRTRTMTRREKSIALAGAALILIVCERLETWQQPKPRPVPHLPQPPLMLMLRPAELWREPVYSKLPNLDVATSYLSRPQGGYAAFDFDNDIDDPMLAIPHVNLVNLSDHAVTVVWELTIKGEGLSFSANGTGKGRWERQLNRNDWFALQGSKLKWRLSPVTLAPHERLYERPLAFVVPVADENVRRLIVTDGIDERFKVTLKVSNLSTGTTSVVTLPFGHPARETAWGKQLQAAVEARRR